LAKLESLVMYLVIDLKKRRNYLLLLNWRGLTVIPWSVRRRRRLARNRMRLTSSRWLHHNVITFLVKATATHSDLRVDHFGCGGSTVLRALWQLGAVLAWQALRAQILVILLIPVQVGRGWSIDVDLLLHLSRLVNIIQPFYGLHIIKVFFLAIMSLTHIIDKVTHIHFIENPNPMKWIFCEMNRSR
jgi:hypothetical protein